MCPIGPLLCTNRVEIGLCLKYTYFKGVSIWIHFWHCFDQDCFIFEKMVVWGSHQNYFWEHVRISLKIICRFQSQVVLKFYSHNAIRTCALDCIVKFAPEIAHIFKECATNHKCALRSIYICVHHPCIVGVEFKYRLSSARNPKITFDLDFWTF